MKKSYLFLIALLLWIFIPTVAFGAKGDVFTIDSLQYCDNGDGSVSLTGHSTFLSGILNIPEVVIYDGEAYSITSIEEQAFNYCWSLTSVTIPSSITSIYKGAFGYCYGLTSITISNSVTLIDDFAFVGCTSLASVTIPGSVTSIGHYAFGNDSAIMPTSAKIAISVGSKASGFTGSGLMSVILCSSVPPSAYDDSFEDVKTSKEMTLYVPKGSKSLYAAATGWKNFSNIIEYDLNQGVTTINSRSSSKVVTSKKYYSVSGKETGILRKGINIVKEKYSDGTSHTYKEVIK